MNSQENQEDKTLEENSNHNQQSVVKLTSYVVAVAFSRWPLGQLCEFLEDKLSVTPEQIGVMRIDRFKGKETNRTILLLHRSLFDKIRTLGYGEEQDSLDFKLTECELKDHNRPKSGFTRNFFIPLPESLTADETRSQLQHKLDVLCNFGMFTDTEKPRLKIPLKSRETGEHRGQAYVTFNHETLTDTIALARVLLHDTRLYTGSEENFERMRCFWAREKDSEAPKLNGMGTKNKMVLNRGKKFW